MQLGLDLQNVEQELSGLLTLSNFGHTIKLRIFQNHGRPIFKIMMTPESGNLVISDSLAGTFRAC